jgi:DNA-binding HxlR family transcriptional regulator
VQSEGGQGAEVQSMLSDLAAAMRLSPDALNTHPTGSKLADLLKHMQQFEHDRDDPVREVAARLGDRWSSLLLLILNTGTFRHATLRRVVSILSAEKAISQRMLTLRLRALERDGLVARKITPTVPPQVDYSLTDLGRELVAIVQGLLAWIESKNGEILDSRRRFEASQS